ncbi:hypothetical protein HER18_02855 [Chryseobacterium sp. NEB161]|nr:hypothetical protein HER18_02855 [Chryseobacterium sp. NEB161]
MKENIVQAIEILETARKEVAALLTEETGLALRVDNTLEKLTNNIKHVGGFGISHFDDAKSNSVVPVAKTFMGINLEDLEAQQETATVEVEKGDKEIFISQVKDLYKTFLDRDTKELADSLKGKDLQVLGVARLAGITVENPSAVKVTQKFINEIKEAITAKNEADKSKEDTLKNLQENEADKSKDDADNDQQ